MKKSRLAWVLAGASLCAGLAHVVPLRAQEVVPNLPPQQVAALQEGEAAYTDRVQLVSDPKARRNLREAQRLIDAKDWSQAVRLLQILLDNKKDYFIEITEGEAKGRRVSIRSEATRMLNGLPREGKQFYEQQFGAQAKALLRQGTAANDPQIYADLTLRYLHTEAGGEAAALLGSYHLDQGQYIVAALCYEKLLSRENGLQRLSPLQLYKAALAFERAGDTPNRERAWQAFEAKLTQIGEGGLPPTLRRFTPQELLAGLSAAGDMRQTAGRDDWTMFMGSPDRAARGLGSVPFLDAHSFVLDINKPVVLNIEHHSTRPLLTQAVKQLQNKPILPGLHPLAVGNDLIYRSYWGIHAYDLKNRVLRWEQPFKVSLWALDNSTEQGNQFQAWKSSYLNQAPSLLFDNTLQGTLSADQTLVYAMEDLAVPPLQNEARFGGGMPRGGRNTDPLAVWENHNKLVAVDLQTGVVAWEIGSTGEENNPFNDTFFLAPPLPLGGKLYVLAETNRDIRLLCLESRPAWLPDLKKEGHKVELVWAQPLCTVETPLRLDPRRRTQAAHLSYADGLLICPTNAGMILAVDLLTRTLVWAHPYQVDSSRADQGNEIPRQFRGGRRFGGPMMEQINLSTLSNKDWYSAAPVLQKGHVVFTAPDAEAVHCLRLRDGTHVWKHARDDEKEGRFLYLAGVFEGKVLLVGPKSCRALNLQDGSVVWTVPTGMPSGRGVACGDTYFLPLRSGEVWSVNLAKGDVVAKSKSRKETPGNLVFHDGDVFSQSVLSLTCYPQLEVAEKKITARLQANPNDPVGLAERGKMRLYRGQPVEAVADLRAALDQPTLHEQLRQDTQERLYEAVCDLLDKDFARHEQELTALEKLVPLPPTTSSDLAEKAAHEAAQIERHLNLARLVAKGRAKQGRMAEVLTALQAAANLKPMMVRAPEDPTAEIQPRAWAQGKLEILLNESTGPQQQALLQTMEQQWSATRADGSLDALRRFADFFHPLCPQGRDAQLLIAQKLLAQAKLQGTGAEFEALIRLQTLERDPDPARAAQAIDALARLNTRLGALEIAAHHYRQLAQKYPRIQVRDGKTGEELYLELATDKRFLPYMDNPKRGPGGAAHLEYEGKLQNIPPSKGVPRVAWADIPAEGFPFRFGIDLTRGEAVLVDIHTGKERDRFGLLQKDSIPEYSVEPATAQAAPTAHLLSGQVLLFTWGRHVYAYDPFIKRGLLWTYDLLNNVTNEHPGYQANRNPQQMIQAGGQVRFLRAAGVDEALGTMTVVGDQGVCFAVREKGLVLVDALTGKERWVREGIPPSAELFSDGDHVYLVAGASDGEPARSLALRGRDGATVAVPPFIDQYQKKKDAFGRHILLEEKNETGAITLRLYDIRTGSNAWQESFPANTLLLNSLVKQTVGAIHADGSVRVYSLPLGKLVLQTYVPPASLTGVRECHLLQDAESWYLACNRQKTEEQAAMLPAGGAMPQPAQPRPPVGSQRTMVRPACPTLAQIYVEGPLFAFDRASGRSLWQTEVPKQCLIIDQFHENPLLIGICVETRYLANRGNPQRINAGRLNSTHFLALDKRHGQTVFTETTTIVHSFMSLNIEPRQGVIELYSFSGNTSKKLSFQAKPAAAMEKSEK